MWRSLSHGSGMMVEQTKATQRDNARGMTPQGIVS